MRTGKWSVGLAACVLLAVVVSIAWGSHGTNVLAGKWATSANGTPGGADFTVVTNTEGAQVLSSMHGTPCAEPTTYYRAFYHEDDGTTGTMAGCTVGSPQHFVGRYAPDAGQGGGVDITVGSATFGGYFTYDLADPSNHYPYSGTFVSHAADDGCCPAPPVTTTPTTTTPTTPPPSTAIIDSTLPKSGRTTTYDAPEPGEVGSYRTPKIGPKTRKLTTELKFVDNAGRPVPPPDVAAVISDITAEDAARLCLIFELIPEYDVYGSEEWANLGACMDVVTQILARSDEINRAKKAGPPPPPGRQLRATVSTTCKRVTRASTKRKWVATCTRSATGLRITIRPRSSKTKKLGSVLKRSPRIAVGRSALDAGGAGDQLKVRWTASSRR